MSKHVRRTGTSRTRARARTLGPIAINTGEAAAPALRLDETRNEPIVRSRYASQDDLDDMKGAIVGFFKGLSTPTTTTTSSDTATTPEISSMPEEGTTRNLTSVFIRFRKRHRGTALLEGNRLEKRLEKLALIHRDTGDLAAREQEVVRWDPDADALACPFCQRKFGKLSQRRHHCRLCGRVVCGQAGCSAYLSVPLPDAEGLFRDARTFDVRCCRECERTIIRHRDRVSTKLPSTVLDGLYAEMQRAMRSIEDILPAFNSVALRAAQRTGTPDLPRAARIRKQLTRAFGDVDQLSKQILKLPANSATDQRLHQAIRRSVAQYLQLHMFPLTMLPTKQKQQRSASPFQRRSSTTISETTGSGQLSASSDISSNDRPLDAADDNDSQPANMADKLSTLEVLRDQRQRVLGYISEAQRDRRLDDAHTLQTSLDELETEISFIEKTL